MWNKPKKAELARVPKLYETEDIRCLGLEVVHNPSGKHGYKKQPHSSLYIEYF